MTPDDSGVDFLSPDREAVDLAAFKGALDEAAVSDLEQAFAATRRELWAAQTKLSLAEQRYDALLREVVRLRQASDGFAAGREVAGFFDRLVCGIWGFGVGAVVVGLMWAAAKMGGG